AATGVRASVPAEGRGAQTAGGAVSASRIEAESAAAARPPGAPEFRSALLDRGPAGGALRPRRLMHDLTLSIAAHVMGAFALIALSLFSVETIPAPPIIIRFLARSEEHTSELQSR